MEGLAGQVAVVTGAASGVGYAVSERCLTEGMTVVLADVDTDALEKAASALARHGRVLAVTTDVSSEASVDELRRRAEELGPVQLLCNNAGVGGWPGPAWELPHEVWEWVVGVNLWGVIHGIRAFLPAMVARDGGFIVNTASVSASHLSRSILPTPPPSTRSWGYRCPSTTNWSGWAPMSTSVLYVPAV